jgi:hypothetical protein
MKYPLSSLIVTLLVIVSCKKEKVDENKIPDGEDYGCIQQFYIKVKDHSISSADVITLDNLFSKNKIDNSNFRYYQYSHDIIQNDFPPYSKSDTKVIWADQFDRGLRIFKAERGFTFYNDTAYEANKVPDRALSKDTIPGLSLPRVRRLFRYDLERYLPKDSNGNRVDYSDTCFIAEFGFYKYKNNNYQTKFYKAWRVQIKNSVNGPIGYYDDESGRGVSFLSK